MASKETGAHAGGVDLHGIVRIGDGIKGVVDTARAVNLAALNAMLSSRRGGDDAVGFRVASSELREISSRLMDAMQNLTELVSDMVGEVARLQRKRRTRAFFSRIPETRSDIPDLLSDLASRQEEETVLLARRIGHSRDDLSRKTAQALRLCDQGSILSRGALIEAAHGGDSAPVLKQVAEQLTLTIRVMTESLAGVHAAVGGVKP